jgi:hypothetical protein
MAADLELVLFKDFLSNGSFTVREGLELHGVSKVPKETRGLLKLPLFARDILRRSFRRVPRAQLTSVSVRF